MKNKHTLGLYLHIPFCASKCRYCDFYSFSSEDASMDRYVEALCAHIEGWGHARQKDLVDTVYLGGGTPSLLGGKRLRMILDSVRNAFSILPESEITVECNPDSMEDALFDALRQAGVNRLSIGVQSASDAELRMLGRRHTFAQAKDAVNRARLHGFTNLSLDLMYGLPGQTVEMVRDSVCALLSLAPEHLSCYALKLEEGTPLFLENPELPDEDVQADMYEEICRLLSQNGFVHYEVSNWAKPGFRARHNSRYWDLSSYLGIGPSAHSLLDGRRFAYRASIEEFIAGVGPCEEETVEGFSEAEEFLMLSLRTCDGVSPEVFEKRFGRSFTAVEERLRRFQKSGLTMFSDGRWSLSEQGFLVSNAILADVLISES